MHVSRTFTCVLLANWLPAPSHYSFAWRLSSYAYVRYRLTNPSGLGAHMGGSSLATHPMRVYDMVSVAYHKNAKRLVTPAALTVGYFVHEGKSAELLYTRASAVRR